MVEIMEWNKESVLQQMLDWQSFRGEDFLDYFESEVHHLSFVFWTLGRGYYSQEKFKKWMNTYINGSAEDNLLSTSMTYYLCGEEDYSMFQHEQWLCALEVLAEFLCDAGEVYKNRFLTFMDGYK